MLKPGGKPKQMEFGFAARKMKVARGVPGNVIKARKEGHYVTPDIEAIAGSRRELEIYRRKLVNQIDASNEMIGKITAGKIMSRSRLREFEEGLLEERRRLKLVDFLLENL